MLIIGSPFGFTPEPLTWSFIGSCVSFGSSLDFSSLSAGAIAAGDLAIYVDYSAGTSTPPGAATPSAFSNSINTSNGLTTPPVRGMLSRKKLDGTETTVTGMNDNSDNKVGLVFRPSSAFTSSTGNDPHSGISENTPTLQTCDPSAETSAVILIGVAGISGGTAAFSSFSPSQDGSATTANGDLLVRYKIYNTAPQSTTVIMSDLGSNNWLASIYFTVS